MSGATARGTSSAASTCSGTAPSSVIRPSASRSPTGPSTTPGRASSPRRGTRGAPSGRELRRELHLDRALLHPHRIGGYRPHGRRRLRVAVADVEARSVAWALDEMAAQFPFAERAAIVRTRVGQRVEVTAHVADEHGVAVDDAPAGPTGSDLTGRNGEPVAGTGVTHRTGTRRARGGSGGCAAPGGRGTGRCSPATAYPPAPAARRRRPVAGRGAASARCRRRTRNRSDRGAAAGPRRQAGARTSGTPRTSSRDRSDAGGDGRTRSDRPRC